MPAPLRIIAAVALFASCVVVIAPYLETNRVAIPVCMVTGLAIRAVLNVGRKRPSRSDADQTQEFSTVSIIPSADTRLSPPAPADQLPACISRSSSLPVD
jgi:hypothetical protein